MKTSIVNLTRRIEALERTQRASETVSNIVSSLDVTAHIAPIYHQLHDDVINCKYDYFNLPGGRGSGKSSFAGLEIVNGVMSDLSGESSAIVFRRFGTTMRDSVYAQISWAIDTLGVSEYWRTSVSPMQFTFIPTGAQIIFRGLDDASKLKSIKPKKGKYKYIWLEELDELPGENFMRSVLQSVMRGGNGFIVFKSFNPPKSKNNWANMYVEKPDNRAITFRTTYLQVPPEWLGESFIYEAERLKQINELAYRHEYLGEATGTGGAVFPNITVREITDSEIEQMQYIYAGIDFGFAVDPAVFIRLSYDRKTETIYLLDEIYKRNLSNHNLAEEIKAKSYDKTGRKIDYNSFDNAVHSIEQQQFIIADSAEPKSIADLRAEGLKMLPCNKYPGSVIYGIKWLQNRYIVIDPKRTPNAYKEFVSYEYMQDKDGNFLSDVPDADNHCIDAVRYGLDRIINNRRNPA